MGYFGWQTRTIQHGDALSPTMDVKPYVMPDFGDLNPSLGLGALGMPG